MADHKPGRLILLLQEVGCCHQIAYLGGKCRRSEISLTLSQTGKIEAQHSNAPAAQGTTDLHHRCQVLGTGETMGEQGVGKRLSIFWEFQPGSEPLTLGI